MGRGMDLLLMLFFAIDFPGAVVGSGVVGILTDRPGPAKRMVASVAMWLPWFSIFRAWEWWKERSVPTVLDTQGR